MTGILEILDTSSTQWYQDVAPTQHSFPHTVLPILRGNLSQWTDKSEQRTPHLKRMDWMLRPLRYLTFAVDSGGTKPSYGQPTMHETYPRTFTPSFWANLMTSSHLVRLVCTSQLVFFRLNVSEAVVNTAISFTPQSDTNNGTICRIWTNWYETKEMKKKRGTTGLWTWISLTSGLLVTLKIWNQGRVTDPWQSLDSFRNHFVVSHLWHPLGTDETVTYWLGERYG
jgi:hypothetical protein